MPFTQVTIANCRRASIRNKPWIPMCQKQIVGIRDGPINNDFEVKNGDIIDVDLEDFCYDWTDRKFYKVRNPKGWIYEGCIDLGGGKNGN